MATALTTQSRVIWALMLREIHTIYGESRLGYLWVMVQTTFNMAVFWMIRAVLGATAPHGITMLTYLVAGFGMWNIINETVNKTMVAVASNRAMLTFAQITPLDLMLSRALVLTATHVLAAIVMLFVGQFFGQPLTVVDWAGVFGLLLLGVLFAFGLGLVLTALAVYFPVLNILVPMVFRVLFFFSGVFFSLHNLPLSSGMLDALNLNPIMHLVELMRSCMAVYPVPDMDVWYVMHITVVLLAVGLLLERFTRRKAQIIV